MPGHVRPLPGGPATGCCPTPRQVADPFHVVAVGEPQRRPGTTAGTERNVGTPRTQNEIRSISDSSVVDHAPKNASIPEAKVVSKDCCGRVTPMEKSVTPGMPKKPHGTSTGSTVRSWLRISPAKSRGTSRTGHCLRKPNDWDVPSPDGPPRSWPGTGPQVTNGPTESLNNLIKRIKRIAFGFRKLRPLPNPSTALHRQTQLEPSRNHHSPVISHEPVKPGL